MLLLVGGWPVSIFKKILTVKPSFTYVRTVQTNCKLPLSQRNYVQSITHTNLYIPMYSTVDVTQRL